MFPVFFAWMAAFSEAVGGLFLMFGFQTRMASFLIMMTMLGAIFLQQINEGMWFVLPALGFLWVSLYSLVLGSGRFGLDFLITKQSAQ
jgi:putative oxidoreductase